MSQNLQYGSVDAYTPAEIARRVETLGVYKASMSALPMMTLGVLGGAFISLGSMNYLVALAQGMPTILASLMFCMGLILIIVGGAELFTSNNLIAMAWAQGKVRTRALLRNWAWIYFANFIGCLGTIALVYLSGMLHAFDMAFGAKVLSVAAYKTNHTFIESFALGILCNSLVCMAVWLCFAARSAVDRIFCIVFPVMAFVNMGFEHCIANMFIIPLAYLASLNPAIVAASNLPPDALQNINLYGFIGNIVPATLGNIVGGSIMVAGMYYLVYLRGQSQEA